MFEPKLSVTVVPLVPLTLIAVPEEVMPNPLVVVTVTGVPVIVCAVSPPVAAPEQTEFPTSGVQLPAHAGEAPNSVPPNTSPAAKAADETAEDMEPSIGTSDWDLPTLWTGKLFIKFPLKAAINRNFSVLLKF